MYNGEDITENNNNRKLNILKGFTNLEDSLEKGHMDFGGGGGKPASGKSNLVQKKITDKRGHNTTKWVKDGSEEKSEEEGSEVDSQDDPTTQTKTSDEHAKETQSDDLKTYIANNPDGEHVAAAQAELQARGESDDMGSGEESETNEYSDMDDDSLYEAIQTGDHGTDSPEQAAMVAEWESRGNPVEDWMMSENDTREEDDNFERTQGGVDYGNPDAVRQAISENRDAVLELMMEDPTLSASHALKFVLSGQGDNTEAHGALDAAQQALDAAKTATGHPDAGGGEEGSDIGGEEEQLVNEVRERLKDAGIDTTQEDVDIDEIENHVSEAISQLGLSEELHDDVRNLAQYVIHGFPGEGENEGGEGMDIEEESNYDPEISAQNLSADIGNAATQEFGGGFAEDKSLHIEDLKLLLDDYNVRFMGEGVTSADIANVKTALEKQGWEFEGGLDDEEGEDEEPESKQSGHVITDEEETEFTGGAMQAQKENKKEEEEKKSKKKPKNGGDGYSGHRNV